MSTDEAVSSSPAARKRALDTEADDKEPSAVRAKTGEDVSVPVTAAPQFLLPSTFTFSSSSFPSTQPADSAIVSSGSGEINPFAVKSDSQPSIVVPATTAQFFTSNASPFKWDGALKSEKSSTKDGEDAEEGARLFGSGLPSAPAPGSPPENASVPVLEKTIVPPKMAEEHKTGEEEDEVLFRKKAKLFQLDKGEGAWKERGAGSLHINRMKDQRLRIVMRVDGVHRLVLNSLLFPDMQVKRLNDRSLQIACFTEDVQPVVYLLRVDRREDGTELLAALERYKAVAPPLVKQDSSEEQPKQETAEEKNTSVKEAAVAATAATTAKTGQSEEVKSSEQVSAAPAAEKKTDKVENGKEEK